MGTVLQTTVVCLLLFGLVAGGEKAGKKLEKSESFDLKPSGQVAHQTVQLVSSIVYEQHSHGPMIIYLVPAPTCPTHIIAVHYCVYDSIGVG